jgi:hypothetical protein
MNYKRKKSRRSVHCTLCTPHRWMGNHKERFNPSTRRKLASARQDIKEME